MNLSKLFSEAKVNPRALMKLNFVLKRGIPFNSPHRFKIVHLGEQEVKVAIPYIRKNKNHINGMHACCLATAAEYSSGLVLLSSLDSDKYRLIMKSLHMDYHYQAKMPCSAEYKISPEEMRNCITDIVDEKNQVVYTCEVDIHDSDKNHICSGKSEWQIKSWEKVKTK